MTALEVRRLPFEFGPETPFQWNPANPAFGLLCNTLSFLAPPFERYMVAATRLALEHIDEEDVRDEADAFLRQEAQHARAHHHHVAALTAAYPGLASVTEEVEARFDALLEREPLRFHLAYAADVEATFTPLFNVFLRHREQLFDNGHPDVAPLFLWHFVEEIEHRSSAKVIYDAVVGDPWYRLRMGPKVFGHMLGSAAAVGRGFDEHVPGEVRMAAAADLSLDRARIGRLLRRRHLQPRAEPPLASVPTRVQAQMLWRLLRAQGPHRSPADEEIPPFADEWIRAYRDGLDVVHWYASP